MHTFDGNRVVPESGGRYPIASAPIEGFWQEIPRLSHLLPSAV